MLQKFSTHCEDFLGSCKPGLIIRARDFLYIKVAHARTEFHRPFFRKRPGNGAVHLLVSRAIRICVRTLGARAKSGARARKGGKYVWCKWTGFWAFCAGMLAEPIRLQTE